MSGDHTSREAGFTIVEVMVAMVILVIGVLGTLTLIEGSLASTSRTTAREQGTNLARDLVERSRQADYASVTASAASSVLAGLLPASEVTVVSPAQFRVTRRNVSYTVAVTACSIDDPTDGVGVGNPSFCDAPDITTMPGDPEPGPAAQLNVLGNLVSLAADGSYLTTACNFLGTNTTIMNAVNSVVSNVAPLSVCSSVSGGRLPYDIRPDDLRRVRVEVSWNRGKDASVAQTTLLTNPRQS